MVAVNVPEICSSLEHVFRRCSCTSLGDVREICQVVPGSQCSGLQITGYRRLVSGSSHLYNLMSSVCFLGVVAIRLVI